MGSNAAAGKRCTKRQKRGALSHVTINVGSTTFVTAAVILSTNFAYFVSLLPGSWAKLYYTKVERRSYIFLDKSMSKVLITGYLNIEKDPVVPADCNEYEETVAILLNKEYIWWNVMGHPLWPLFLGKNEDDAETEVGVVCVRSFWDPIKICGLLLMK